MSDSGHADAILSYLDQISCQYCGNPAVRGARICLDCARRLSTGELVGKVRNLPVEDDESE